MNTENRNSKGAVLTGVIAALAASSCCIPPAITFVAGVGGASSSLAWMEPLRPYLIALAVVAIGYSWYAHLKPKKTDDCGCDIEKSKFYQTKGFLIGMTLFASLSISFPYYSGVFYATGNTTDMSVINENEVTETIIKIDGMTCEGCEHHVSSSANEMHGVIESSASFEKGEAVVKYDQSLVSKEEIGKAIEEATGYLVTEYESTKQN
ncbi:MAG: mercuric transport protein MerTP [Flavobacteriales bacterium]|nr:mercuric transport protein MerTP [Flavobacteriales bacterium]